MPAGLTLRIETFAPAMVHWGINSWQTVHDANSRDTTVGVHLVDLPTAALPPGGRVEFTFYWPQDPPLGRPIFASMSNEGGGAVLREPAVTVSGTSERAVRG